MGTNWRNTYTIHYGTPTSEVSAEQNSGSGLAYLAKEFVYGIGNTFEGIGDLIYADAYSNDPARQQYELQKSDLDHWIENSRNTFNPSAGWKFAGDVSGGIGQSVIYIGLSAVPYVGKGLTFAAASASATGNALSGLAKEGRDIDTAAWLYSGTVGVAEGAIELISGGSGRAAARITGGASKKIAGKTLGNFLANGLVRAGFEGFTEGAEEGVSYLVELGAKHLYDIDPNAQFSWKELMYQIAVGVVSGVAIAGATGSYSDGMNVRKGNSIIKEGQVDTVLNMAENYLDGFDPKSTNEYYIGLKNAYKNYSKIANKESASAKIALAQMSAYNGALTVSDGVLDSQAEILLSLEVAPEETAAKVNAVLGTNLTAEQIAKNEGHSLEVIGAYAWANKFVTPTQLEISFDTATREAGINPRTFSGRIGDMMNGDVEYYNAPDGSLIYAIKDGDQYQVVRRTADGLYKAVKKGKGVQFVRASQKVDAAAKAFDKASAENVISNAVGKTKAKAKTEAKPEAKTKAKPKAKTEAKTKTESKAKKEAKATEPTKSTETATKSTTKSSTKKSEAKPKKEAKPKESTKETKKESEKTESTTEKKEKAPAKAEEKTADLKKDEKTAEDTTTKTSEADKFSLSEAEKNALMKAVEGDTEAKSDIVNGDADLQAAIEENNDLQARKEALNNETEKAEGDNTSKAENATEAKNEAVDETSTEVKTEAKTAEEKAAEAKKQQAEKKIREKAKKEVQTTYSEFVPQARKLVKNFDMLSVEKRRNILRMLRTSGKVDADAVKFAATMIAKRDGLSIEFGNYTKRGLHYQAPYGRRAMFVRSSDVSLALLHELWHDLYKTEAGQKIVSELKDSEIVKGYADDYAKRYKEHFDKEISEELKLEEGIGDMLAEKLNDTRFVKRFAMSNGNFFRKAQGFLSGLMADIWNVNDPAYREARRLEKMFTEAIGQEETDSLITIGVNTDVIDPEDASKYSISSLANAAGFEAKKVGNAITWVKDNKTVSEVTVDDIKSSPIGALIQHSLNKGFITEQQATDQYEMFSKICTMSCKTNDFSMSMAFVGSAVFTAMKTNADKQYNLTYDFTAVCTKIQAVVDQMSASMVANKRALTKEEIDQIYKQVLEVKLPVPCPECYVFSRWVGIGGLLDNIYSYQERFGAMTADEVRAEYARVQQELSDLAAKQGITEGKGKAKLAKQFQKEYDAIQKKINDGVETDEDLARMKEIEKGLETISALGWIKDVYFSDSKMTRVRKNYAVPSDVLFDLNRGEEFAKDYAAAWKFRTTQGAGYGKAITPYADAQLGEGILITNNTRTIKEKAEAGRSGADFRNLFLLQNGALDKNAQKVLDRAQQKQLNQLFLGGQRFSSTSDAVHQNALDFLIAALEMQAMGGGVQVYTKVDGAVEAYSKWGFFINQSVMPKGNGFNADGTVAHTPIGGMNEDVAKQNREKFENAGTISIGVGDAHIRALLGELWIDFVIPYHASGGDQNLIESFIKAQDPDVQSAKRTDYTKTQGDKILSDDVLKWQGKTDAEIELIKARRSARIAILTRGKVDMEIVQGSAFLSALYDKLNGGEWDGVKVPAGTISSQIFPNEFWDTSVNYENSGVNTQRYLDYCEELGFLHRFSGLVPMNGKLVSVNGVDANGNTVALEDLAYTNGEVNPYFWKLLVDRRMYGNDGRYLAQGRVVLNTNEQDIRNFAMFNRGRQYDAKKSAELARKRNEVAALRAEMDSYQEIEPLEKYSLDDSVDNTSDSGYNYLESVDSFEFALYQEISLPVGELSRIQSAALTLDNKRRGKLLHRTLSNGITYTYMLDNEGIVHVYDRSPSESIHERENKYDNRDREQFDKVAESLRTGPRHDSFAIDTVQNGRKSAENDRRNHSDLRREGNGNRRGDFQNQSASNRYQKRKLVRAQFNDDASHGAYYYSDGTVEKFSLDDTHRDAAVAEFGTTTNFEQTGFVTDDGKMLKLSEYGMNGVRHANIERVFNGEVKDSAAVTRFIHEGNVRIKATSPGIEISAETPVTVSQLNVISRFISQSLRNRRTFYLDITDADGNSVASVSYDDSMSTELIMYDIKDYYRYGDIPKGSDFYYEKWSLDNVPGMESVRVEPEKDPRSLKERATDWTRSATIGARILFVDAYAGVIDYFVKVGGMSQLEAEVAVQNVRSADARANGAIETGQYVDGKIETSLLNILRPIHEKGVEEERLFYTYLLHLHNIDRMSLEKKSQAELDKIGEDLRAAHKKVLEIAKQIKAGKKNGENVDLLYAKLEKAVKKEAWLESKQSNFVVEQNKPVFGKNEARENDITADESREAVEMIEAERPEFRKSAEQIWKFNQNLLKRKVESGLITQKDMDFLMEKYPHYVPTGRADAKPTVASIRGASNIEVVKGIKKATGSGKDILNLGTLIAANATQTYRAAATNELLGKIYDVMEETGDERYVSVIGSKKHYGTETTEDQFEVKQKLQKVGGRNVGQATFYRDGQAITMQVTNEILAGFNSRAGYRFENNGFIKVWKKIVDFWKKSVTSYSPFFAIRNKIRDLQDAGINSKYPTAFLKNLVELRAEREIWNNGRYWLEFMAIGGFNTSAFDVRDFQSMAEISFGVTERGFEWSADENTVKRTIKRFFNSIEMVNAFIEQTTRLNEFIAAREAGATIEEALLASQEVTVNFGRMGTLTKTLNSYLIPFLNPAIQGTSRIYRNIVESTQSVSAFTSMLLKIAFFGGIIPQIIFELAYSNDDEYEELKDTDKSIYYIFPNIFTGEGFIKIPKGRVTSMFAGAVVQTASAIEGEGFDFLGWFESTAQNNLPFDTASRTFASPLLDAATNHTWYGGEIEGQQFDNVRPENRYDENTSSIAIGIGKLLNVSPKRVHYVIDQYSGIFGDIMLPLTTEAGERSPVAAAFTIDPVRSNELSTQFYKLYDEATYSAEEGNDVAYYQKKYLDETKKAVSELYKQKSEINSSNKSDKQKLEETRILQAMINELQRKAIDDYEMFTQTVYEGMAVYASYSTEEITKSNYKSYGLSKESIGKTAVLFDGQVAATYDDLEKADEYIDTNSKKIAYAQMLRLSYGTDRALKALGLEEKAAEVAEYGITYDEYWQVYFGTRYIRGDNKKSEIIKYLKSIGFTTEKIGIILHFKGYSGYSRYLKKT